jgi:predicted nucleic acid-binding protein
MYLLDTNILARLANREDPQHVLIRDALDSLVRDGATLYYTPQNVVELWNVLTRPKEQNGSGLTAPETNRAVSLLEAQFTLLPENEQLYAEWRRLVVTHSVSGRQVHDARLAAAMIVHGIGRVLTLDRGDFERYPEVTAVHPRDLVLAG